MRRRIGVGGGRGRRGRVLDAHVPRAAAASLLVRLIGKCKNTQRGMFRRLARVKRPENLEPVFPARSFYVATDNNPWIPTTREGWISGICGQIPHHSAVKGPLFTVLPTPIYLIEAYLGSGENTGAAALMVPPTSSPLRKFAIAS